MKLELKYITPYLPYGLTYQTYLPIMGENGKKIPTINILHPDDVEPLLDTGKLFDAEATIILRPLSDLTKEIEHKGQKGGDLFIPVHILMCPTFKFCADKEELLFNLQSPESIERCPYNVVQKLLEWHFNVFDLPEHLWINKAKV